MTQPLTREQIMAVVDAYNEWLISHDLGGVADNLMEEWNMAGVKVEPSSPASANLADLAVAVFTSRAAMRKAYQLIIQADFPTEGNSQSLAFVTVRELQDAILNCTNVIYWLEHQGVAEVIPPTCPPASPEGGAS